MKGYIKRSEVIKNQNAIDKYKVSIGKVVPSNGEVDTDPRDGYKVITSNRVIPPGYIFTESYLLLKDFNNPIEAHNFAKYMALKFPRFIMKQTLSSMNRKGACSLKDTYSGSYKILNVTFLS